MQKLQTLHQFITGLKEINPENVKTFADDIETKGGGAASESFVVNYTIVSYLSNIPTGNHIIADVSLFLLEKDWELSPKFTTEILDSSTTDLIIALNVSEDVILTPSTNGRYLSGGKKCDAVWQGFGDDGQLHDLIIFDNTTQQPQDK